MATTSTKVYIFSILIPLCTLVLCEDEKLSPTFPGLPNLPSLPSFPGFSSLFSQGGRQGEVEHDEDHEKQDRLFFGLIPTLTTCNFTTEAGRTCRSCTESLTCLPNNVGLLRTCRGLFRYCNNGRCSLIQGSACSTTESTSTTTTTTTTTTTPAP